MLLQFQLVRTMIMSLCQISFLLEFRTNINQSIQEMQRQQKKLLNLSSSSGTSSICVIQRVSCLLKSSVLVVIASTMRC